MAPPQLLAADCQISEWLNRIQPGCAPGITTAFNEVGVECIQDLYSIDEEVYEALEIELRAVGAQTAQINKVKKAIEMTVATCPSRASHPALPSLPEEMADDSCLPVDNGLIQQRHLQVSKDTDQNTNLLEYPPGLESLTTSTVKEACQIVKEKMDGSRMHILGSIWQLSKDKSGCREVQKLLESSDEETCQLIASELKGRICEAALCPNANHVLRRCITLLKPSDVGFIIDEIADQGPSPILAIARHRFGCRILEGLLTDCKIEQLSDIIECLLGDVVMLCQHMFGNYVIQALLKYGTEGHCKRLLMELVSNISALGKNFYGSAVLLNVLHHKSPEDQREIASALAATPGLFAAIMSFKRGPCLVQKALDILDEPEREVAYQELQAHGLQQKLDMAY